MNYAMEIKERIKMPEILKFYGVDMNRAGRIKCPMHGGKDFNCGVKNDYIHCFVCGESADQITFVENMFGLSFIDAVTKINDDFCLNLPIGKKLSHNQRLQIAKQGYEREKKRKQESETEKQLNDKYWEIYSEVVRLERNKKDFAPKTPSEDPHPLFIEAVTYLEEEKHKLELADVERYKYEHRNR